MSIVWKTLCNFLNHKAQKKKKRGILLGILLFLTGGAVGMGVSYSFRKQKIKRFLDSLDTDTEDDMYELDLDYDLDLDLGVD